MTLSTDKLFECHFPLVWITSPRPSRYPNAVNEKLFVRSVENTVTIGNELYISQFYLLLIPVMAVVIAVFVTGKYDREFRHRLLNEILFTCI